MGDRFYTIVRALGGIPFRLSARPVVIGTHLVPPRGPIILASTHQSPYDVPLLIHHSPRPLDFVSTTEVFSNRPVGWFYGHMNAFPLDRSRPDSRTVRTILTRLRAGRAVAMFPEGGLRPGENSLVRSRSMKAGIGRLAHIAGAPVVPCVILNSAAYSHFQSWLPLGHTRYGIIFGEPIPPTGIPAALEDRFLHEVTRLHAVLSDRLALRAAPVPP